MVENNSRSLYVNSNPQEDPLLERLYRYHVELGKIFEKTQPSRRVIRGQKSIEDIANSRLCFYSQLESSDGEIIGIDSPYDRLHSYLYLLSSDFLGWVFGQQRHSLEKFEQDWLLKEKIDSTKWKEYNIVIHQTPMIIGEQTGNRLETLALEIPNHNLLRTRERNNPNLRVIDTYLTAMNELANNTVIDMFLGRNREISLRKGPEKDEHSLIDSEIIVKETIMEKIAQVYKNN